VGAGAGDRDVADAALDLEREAARRRPRADVALRVDVDHADRVVVPEVVPLRILLPRLPDPARLLGEEVLLLPAHLDGEARGVVADEQRMAGLFPYLSQDTRWP